MMLEYCLVLGFVVPIILPLTGITFLLHLAVFHRSVENGFTLQMDAKPSSLYLYGSFLLGCALVIWFFWENDLHGKELIAAGVPTMAFAAWGLQMVMPVSKAPWSWLSAPTKAVAKVEMYSVKVKLSDQTSLGHSTREEVEEIYYDYESLPTMASGPAKHDQVIAV